MLEPKKIFIAGGLLSRYPLICKTIYDVCDREGVEFGILSGAKNIWVRDYMPIPASGGRYLKFKYAEDWIKYPIRKDSPKTWSKLPDVALLDLFLDGGNCVVRGDVAFVTQKAITDNDNGIVKALGKAFKLAVYVLPVEPGDDLGHADGIINFAPDGSVFINDYSVMKSKEYDQYLGEVIKAVEAAGLAWRLFPFAYHKMPKITEKVFRKKFPHADDFNPAYGYYINYLRVGNTFILPVFGIEEDQKAMQMFDGIRVEPVDCSELSMEGGLIRCVTWESYAIH